MSQQPFVELTFDEESLNLPPRKKTTRGDPTVTIEAALVAARLHMIKEAEKEAQKRGAGVLSSIAIRSALDEIWRTFVPTLHSTLVPMLAAEYAFTFSTLGGGDVDLKIINALATQHADRLGEYFHQTSRDAMIQGFNAQVNRKVPPRMAFSKALDAYGLTPRQMNSLVALDPPDPKKTALVQDLKRKPKEFIGASIRQRFKIFAEQETHNLDNQAQQIVWNYLEDKGKIPKEAEKVWLTAKDELVCPVCGPLHGVAVPVGEKFQTDVGKLWVPGAHVNCRCRMRLRHPTKDLSEFSKAKVRTAEGSAFFGQPIGSEIRADPEKVTYKDRTSPDFDRLLRETQQVEEGPRLKEEASGPRLNTGSSGPRLRAQGPQARGETGPRLKEETAGPRLGEGLQMRELQAAELSLSGVEPAAVGLTPQQLVQQNQKLKIATSPKVDHVTQVLKERAKLETPSQTKTKYETKILPLDKPVYRLISRDELDVEGRKVEFHQDDFVTSEEEAREEMHRAIQNEIDKRVVSILANQDNVLSFADHNVGLVTATIPDDQVRTAVIAAAHGYPDEFIEVSFDSPDGESRVLQRMTASEMGEAMGVEKGDLDFFVGRARFVWNDGMSGQVTSESKYGYAEITGQYLYEMEDIGEGQILLNLEPNVDDV